MGVQAIPLVLEVADATVEGLASVANKTPKKTSSSAHTKMSPMAPCKGTDTIGSITADIASQTNNQLCRIGFWHPSTLIRVYPRSTKSAHSAERRKRDSTRDVERAREVREARLAEYCSRTIIRPRPAPSIAKLDEAAKEARRRAAEEDRKFELGSKGRGAATDLSETLDLRKNP